MKNRLQQHGVSLIEFALIAPILILILLCVVDFGRAIQANNIIINISREAGNLSARTASAPQYIMTAVADTSEPLDMPTNGGIIITQLSAVSSNSATARVIEQSRWTNGRNVVSRIWNGCGAWNVGTCQLPATAPQVTLPVQLMMSGDIVYAVEVFYRYEPLFELAMPIDNNLYSLTIL